MQRDRLQIQSTAEVDGGDDVPVGAQKQATPDDYRGGARVIEVNITMCIKSMRRKQ
jgi:hypothetical protein